MLGVRLVGVIGGCPDWGAFPTGSHWAGLQHPLVCVSDVVGDRTDPATATSVCVG